MSDNRDPRDKRNDDQHAIKIAGNISAQVKIPDAVEINLLPDLMHEYKSSNRDTNIREDERDARDKRRMRIEIVTLVILVLVAAFNLIQTRQAITSTAAATVAAKSAEEQLRLNIWDERALLTVEQTNPAQMLVGQPVRQELVIKNAGKTPAKRIKGFMYAEIIYGMEPAHFGSLSIHRLDFYYNLQTPGEPHPMVAARMEGPLDTAALLYSANPLTQDEKSAIDKGQAWIAVHGRIEYADRFKTDHWTNFCFPTYNHTISAIQNRGGCVSYNDFDDE